MKTKNSDIKVCTLCDTSYEDVKKECPTCGAPNESHELPDVIAVNVIMELELWRAVTAYAVKKDLQPNRVFVEAVEEFISRKNSGKKVS